MILYIKLSLFKLPSSSLLTGLGHSDFWICLLKPQEMLSHHTFSAHVLWGSQLLWPDPQWARSMQCTPRLLARSHMGSLVMDPPRPVRPSDEAIALADVMTATIWETQTQSPLAKLLTESWPQKLTEIKKCLWVQATKFWDKVLCSNQQWRHLA